MAEAVENLRWGGFVAGVLIACLVYGLAPVPIDFNDPATIGDEKGQSRQIAQLYGDAGLLERDWFEKLRQPGTQAILIVAAAAVVAGGCLFVARVLDHKKTRGEGV